MGILRVWIRAAVGASVEGGKSGRPSGSMVVISVSVVSAFVGGKGIDDSGGVDGSGTEALEGFVVMSRSSSSGGGIVSPASCISSSGRLWRAVGAGIFKA